MSILRVHIFRHDICSFLDTMDPRGAVPPKSSVCDATITQFDAQGKPLTFACDAQETDSDVLTEKHYLHRYKGDLMWTTVRVQCGARAYVGEVEHRCAKYSGHRGPHGCATTKFSWESSKDYEM